MLMLSITLHNIPEGLAIGVAFGPLIHNNLPVAAAFAKYPRFETSINKLSNKSKQFTFLPSKVKMNKTRFTKVNITAK